MAPLARLRPAELHKYYVSLGTQYLYLLLHLKGHIFLSSPPIPPISNAEWEGFLFFCFFTTLAGVYCDMFLVVWLTS